MIRRTGTVALLLGTLVASGTLAACSNDEPAKQPTNTLPAGSCGYVYAADEETAGDIRELAAGRDAAACMKRALQAQRRAVLVVAYPGPSGIIVNTYRLVDGGRMTLNSARGDEAKGIDGDAACISPKWLLDINCD